MTTTDTTDRQRRRREARQRVAERGGWPKLAYRQLGFEGRDRVVHQPTGRCYRIVQRHVDQADADVAGYFVDAYGHLVFVELVYGPTETTP